ncbi:MAG TPA: hypothetical protein VH326_01615 [Sphingomonas sp.]|nr:hypothetical protein [Sphingomonas sp.]
MIRANAVKTSGYLISSVSVILLGAVAWKSASEHPLTLVCLIAGMALSIAGMLLRWLSYQIDKKNGET